MLRVFLIGFLVLPVVVSLIAAFFVPIVLAGVYFGPLGFGVAAIVWTSVWIGVILALMWKADNL